MSSNEIRLINETAKAVLRDEFAKAALQGMLSNAACMQELLDIDDRPMVVAQHVVARAYLYADECLEHTTQVFDKPL